MTDNRNMYGCTPCPKCGSVYRVPYNRHPHGRVIDCDDCGYCVVDLLTDAEREAWSDASTDRVPQDDETNDLLQRLRENAAMLKQCEQANFVVYRLNNLINEVLMELELGDKRPVEPDVLRSMADILHEYMRNRKPGDVMTCGQWRESLSKP